jgi:dTDP-4-amino-4,6-dideoxygalactose transaminase
VSAKRVHGSRIIPFQEKRLFGKLSRFDRLVAHQKEIVAVYEKLLAQTTFKPLELDGNVEPIYYKYPILAERKQEIFEKAPEARVELSDMFVSPVYPSWREAKWKALGYCQGMCPISEEISDKIVALPVHARVKVKDIKKTITFLESFSSVR